MGKSYEPHPHPDDSDTSNSRVLLSEQEVLGRSSSRRYGDNGSRGKTFDGFRASTAPSSPATASGGWGYSGSHDQVYSHSTARAGVGIMPYSSLQRPPRTAPASSTTRGRNRKSHFRSQRENLAATSFMKVTLGKGTRLEREKEVCENFQNAVVTSRVLENGHFFGETALFAAISHHWQSERVQIMVKGKGISDRVCELGRIFCEKIEGMGNELDAFFGAQKRPVWGSVVCKEGGKVLCLSLQDMPCLLYGDWNQLLAFLGNEAENFPSEAQLMDRYQGLASYNSMKRTTLTTKKSKMKELEFWRVGGHSHRVEQWD